MKIEQAPTYEELKQRLANAEGELQALRHGQVDTIEGEHRPLVVRSAKAEVRADHIKQVLLAIRNVNQLIVSEDDPLRLIERACVNLTEKMGYLNAWIALLDDDAKVAKATAGSGFDGGFSAMRKRLEAGVYTDCMKRALDHDGIVVVNAPKSQCTDCPLSVEYGGRAGLSRRLRHGGKTYGVLSVSVPEAFAADDEEQALFDELAGDLAFALHKIEAARNLRERQAMLARTEQIAHVGSWEWDIADDRVRWSEELFRIFQRDPRKGAPCFAEHPDLYVTEDMQRLRSLVERCRTDGTPYELELRAIRRDGQIRCCVARGQAETDAHGQINRLVGSVQDITERKQAEETIRANERYLHAILQTSADGFWVLDANGAVIEVNDAYCAISGYKRDELLGMRIGELDAVETIVDTAARIQRITANGSELFETRHRRKDGSVWPVEVSATWMDDYGGRFVCFGRDLTERKLRDESIALLGQMLDAAPASITIHDTDGRFLFANRLTAALHGYADEAEFCAINLHDLDVPESEALLKERFRRIVEEGGAHFEVAHYRKDGSIFPLEVMTKLIEYDGRPAVLSIATDITERKRVEAALRESEERNRLLSDVTMEGIVLHKNGVAIDFNSSLTRMLGFNRDELLHKNLLALIHEGDRGVALENIIKAYAPPYTIRMARKNGEYFFAEIESRDFPKENDMWRVSAVRDITERKRTEETLRLRENQLQKIFEILPIGLWFADKNGTLLRGNPMGVKIWGAEPHVPITEYGIFKAWRLPSREPLEGEDWALAKTVRTGVTIVDELLEIESFDGKRKTILNYTAPVLDDDGAIDGAIVVNLDISDRQTLEDQLRQAQKMESVGRLAGGVAHDFNNMLSVILGHTELAMDHLAPDDPLREDLKEILNAAQRSSDITRQLLAFASKQTIAPKVIDLNETIEGMLKMLRRLISEDIDLAWRPEAAIWPVKMDPSQIDQILANLCVNARDAIAGVGNLTIETRTMTLDEADCAARAEFVPGNFVLLTVSDDGCGMDQHTLDKLFEPFFTTKGVGKGTGLGLATVYGIVKQNQGFIDVSSEPGQGTTFRIYLPAYNAFKAQAAPEAAAPAPRARRGETILVVEDEPAILRMTTRMLERLGYAVLSANMPSKAIDLARNHAGKIHLLMTDVVMPEMNGRDLALSLVSFYPSIKRLFMSGYTANVIAHHGVLDEDVHFIQKPFSNRELAVKVRETLGA